MNTLFELDYSRSEKLREYFDEGNNQLECKCRHKNGSIFFTVSEPPQFENEILKVVKGTDYNRLLPLYKHMATVPYVYTLHVIPNGDGICGVTNVHLDNDAKSLRSRDFYQHAIRRFKHIPLTQEVESDSDFEPIVPLEYEAFFRLIKNTLPSWHRTAFDKNLKLYKFGNSDEKAHAQIALDFLINVEFNTGPNFSDLPDKATARIVLDEKLFGLDDVKQEILNALSVVKRSGSISKGILLVGPPGCGKTAIAKAAVELFGCKHIYVDVNTLSKETDGLFGSPRVFKNARMGMLAEQLWNKVRSNNFVLVLNELEKAEGPVFNSFLSLIEGGGIYDNFLEFTIPCNSFCIATANDTTPLSAALLDRFHVINITPYTDSEKDLIFHNYLLPAVSKEYNAVDMVEFDAAAKEELKKHYPTLSIRGLKNCAQRILEQYCFESDGSSLPKLVTLQEVRRIMGPPKKINRAMACTPGLVTTVGYNDGTAFLFPVEAVARPGGTGKFEVLGIDEKLKDFCKAAYVAATRFLQVALDHYDITIFVPQPLPVTGKNFLGLATFFAIYSAITGTVFDPEKYLVLGGIDLHGNIFFDESDLSPMVKLCESKEIKYIYSPLGTSELASYCGSCSFSFIEIPNAVALLELISAK